MDRPAAALVLLLAVAVVAGPAAGAGPFGLAAAQEFDRVQFVVTVSPDGDADWTFRYERRLANESERQQFATFADRFNSEVTPLFRDFRNQTVALTDLGREATARPMNATDVSRQATIEEGLNTVGVVELTFTWTAFAPTRDGRVVVGDVFEGGFYLAPDQAFVIAAGGNLEFAAIEPDGTLSGSTMATSDTVTWQGERTFADNHPRVVLVPQSMPNETVSPGTTSAGGDGDGSPRSPTRSPATGTPVTGGGPPWGLLGVALVAVVGGLAAFVWLRRNGGVPTRSESAGGGPSLTEAELMEDEERVVSLLEDRGGRMRQSAIVDETGWSKSKVSMVLSEMTDDGTVSKLQLGRENLISLPGHEPEAAGSALEALDEGADDGGE